MNTYEAFVAVTVSAFAMIMITIIVTRAIQSYSVAYQARLAHRAKAGDDKTDSDLAEKMTTTQTSTAASLAALQADMADMKAKLASIEKMLREVSITKPF